MKRFQLMCVLQRILIIEAKGHGYGYGYRGRNHLSSYPHHTNTGGASDGVDFTRCSRCGYVLLGLIAFAILLSICLCIADAIKHRLAQDNSRRAERINSMRVASEGGTYAVLETDCNTEIGDTSTVGPVGPVDFKMAP